MLICEFIRPTCFKASSVLDAPLRAPVVSALFRIYAVEPFWTVYLELRSTAVAFAGMINKQSNSRANAYSYHTSARYGDLSDVAALVPRQYLDTVASKSNEPDTIGITTVPRPVGHRIARRQFIKSKIDARPSHISSPVGFDSVFPCSPSVWRCYQSISIVRFLFSLFIGVHYGCRS
jgi:hypothetical protein